MSVNDNNRLIVRTFAYSWKFKKLYEKGVRMEDIMKQEKMTKRTIYKYLNLAYLSPKIVNQLLSGTLTINLQTLFDIASKNLSFKEQEKMLLEISWFYGILFILYSYAYGELAHPCKDFISHIDNINLLGLLSKLQITDAIFHR